MKNWVIWWVSFEENYEIQTKLRTSHNLEASVFLLVEVLLPGLLKTGSMWNLAGEFKAK